MPRYAAFLRAINVGGHVVRMEDLRRHFSALGFATVETVIASGNVLFDAPSRSAEALERKIEAALRRALGYEVATFLRTRGEMARLAAADPFAGVDRRGAILYVAFLGQAPPAAARARLLDLAGPTDDFRVTDREVFWLCRKRMSESRFSGAVLEKTLGMPATLRNVTTVQRIAAKLA
jgi:uncharacterized protein (DUF1697 family)